MPYYCLYVITKCSLFYYCKLPFPENDTSVILFSQVAITTQAEEMNDSQKSNMTANITSQEVASDS